jgi:hypothetical protein
VPQLFPNVPFFQAMETSSSVERASGSGVIIFCDPSSGNAKASVGDHCSHLTGDHQEGPDRVSCILESVIRARDSSNRYTIEIIETSFPHPSRDLLEGVHDGDYLEWLGSVVAKQELHEQDATEKTKRRKRKRKRTNKCIIRSHDNHDDDDDDDDVPRPLTPLLLRDLVPDEWQRYVSCLPADVKRLQLSLHVVSYSCHDTCFLRLIDVQEHIVINGDSSTHNEAAA